MHANPRLHTSRSRTRISVLTLPLMADELRLSDERQIASCLGLARWKGSCALRQCSFQLLSESNFQVASLELC